MLKKAFNKLSQKCISVQNTEHVSLLRAKAAQKSHMVAWN